MLYPAMTPTQIQDIREFLQPEPMDAPPLTHEQLRDACRELVPERCVLWINIHICDGPAEVEIYAVLDERAVCIDECATCEEALAAFKANVEGLRFGLEVRV